MIDLFLVYGIGWRWWAGLGLVPIVVGVILLVRVVGLTRALQIGAGLLAALGAAVMLRRARQQGWQEREDKLNRDTAEAVDDYRKKRDEVADLPGTELDRRAQRWVRDDEAR
ncbi:hypothetical protein [Ancylobacter sp. TS-1]|uniref:hypothetical protein n=1 Tax=Ancylobacter sp. TS-1 TaxID=1850374 RepID=UPI001265C480|nr:hypothetical protein [Ancylobacter sp. TS-1]QFR32399.1 hypothetical protein GBB76_04305 [Ancylobacter sp. TS-1]